MSILGSALDIIDKVFSYFSNKQLIDAGKAEIIAQSVKDQNDALQIAQTARDNVAVDLARNADGLHVDDGFKRGN
jgi:hypothetical protein